MSLFSELKQRNVFRVAAAYLVTAWLLIEVSATLEETLHLPEWADSLMAMFLVLGFPIALFFSWAYEITPEGLKKEKDLEGHRPSRSRTGQKLDRIIMILMALALAYFALDKFYFSEEKTPPASLAPHGAVPTATETAGADQDATIASEYSIAVLPFVNMSSDPEQEYFSDGLSEELLNLLAKINGLKVAARTSSFFYKDKQGVIPFPEIGAQLGVAYVLEGSVRKSDNKIRVTAQLIHVENGFHQWSETWDRELNDVFAIQDEIAAAVTDQLKMEIFGETPHATIIDTESWELTLQGRYFFSRRNPGDLELALAKFQQAVAIDPSNASAWAGMAPIFLWIFDPPKIEASRQAVENALKLEPTNPEAHVRMGNVQNRLSNREQASFHYQRAWELGPDNPLVLSVWSGLLTFHGETKQATELLEKAVIQDPLYLVNVSNLAWLYLDENRLREASELLERTLRLAPESAALTETLAEVRLNQGRPEETLALLEQATWDSANPWHFTRPLIKLLSHHALGHESIFELAMQNYIAEYSNSDPVAVAYLYGSLAEVDTAFEYLALATEDREFISGQMLNIRYLNALRSDPRWASYEALIPDGSYLDVR